jgi:hypothetical protein
MALDNDRQTEERKKRSKEPGGRNAGWSLFVYNVAHSSGRRGIMKRTLFLSGLVAVVALVLAAGSYSALAGSGPITDVAGAVMGLEDPDLDGDDGVQVDGDGVELQGGDGEGAGHVAEVIGEAFEVDDEDVLALHEAGFGFGAIFKLYLLAAAGDETAEAILSSGEKGEGGFAFGKLFKEFADEVSALTDGEDGLPKNLGKAVSGSKKDGTGVTVAGTGDGDEDDGQGPPEHAPAHGRNKD